MLMLSDDVDRQFFILWAGMKLNEFEKFIGENEYLNSLPPLLSWLQSCKNKLKTHDNFNI